jgi:hypothetical protein
MKLPAQILILFVAIALCITGTRAQGTPNSVELRAQASDPALSSQNPPSATPHPSPEMESVTSALSGRWSVTMKFEPSKEMPNGAEGRGEEVWRSGPGGFTFMEEADDHTPFGEVFLTGFMWWDTVDKKFRGMLCTSQNRSGCDPQSSLNDVHLSWDGKRFVVDIESEQNGKKMLWHEVFFDITPTSFTQTGDAGEAGAPLKREVTIHATKVARETQSSK